MHRLRPLLGCCASPGGASLQNMAGLCLRSRTVVAKSSSTPYSTIVLPAVSAPSATGARTCPRASKKGPGPSSIELSEGALRVQARARQQGHPVQHFVLGHLRKCHPPQRLKPTTVRFVHARSLSQHRLPPSVNDASCSSTLDPTLRSHLGTQPFNLVRRARVRLDVPG
eukprot:8139694-Pyramimonas_sp.AAC.1